MDESETEGGSPPKLLFFRPRLFLSTNFYGLLVFWLNASAISGKKP